MVTETVNRPGREFESQFFDPREQHDSEFGNRSARMQTDEIATRRKRDLALAQHERERLPPAREEPGEAVKLERERVEIKLFWASSCRWTVRVASAPAVEHTHTSGDGA